MPLPITQLKISDAEHRQRCDQLLSHLQAEGLNGVVLFDSQYILYYTGFAFIPTERPIAFAMNSKGERALFVPRLEVEHAKSLAMVDRVDHYNEYPDRTHPMDVFARALAEMGLKSGKIGASHDGYPWILGYRGPELSKITGSQVVSVCAFIEDQMMLKSPAEIELMRESIRWANLAHVLLQRYTVVGATETAVSQRASHEANLAMLDAIGPIYRAQSAFYDGASAGYRGQIGRNSAIPHALSNNIAFQAGDVLVTGASAPVWGYVSELERTMIIGKPTDEQRRFFDHMLALQDIALEALGPGKPCSVVEDAVLAYFEKQDLLPYRRHHVGHAIGLRYHEAPFLDVGDQTLMQPGMIFTIEPGIYSGGVGGFRHSDTVLITETGSEIMTYYPRDLESLTLPV